MAKERRLLRGIAISLVLLALSFSGALLAKDAGVELLARLTFRIISAVSLLAVGLAFLIAQPMRRPQPWELLKNVLLSSTFVLWGVVQLMPQNGLAMRFGNLVIALFVLDLAWATLAGVKSNQEWSGVSCSSRESERLVAPSEKAEGLQGRHEGSRPALNNGSPSTRP